jgi:hypothetical protein
MTPNEIATIFAEATNNFALISGQPTNKDINPIELAILPLMHDIDYNMFGTQNLVSLIEPTATYLVTWGQAFVQLVRPTAYDLTINNAATLVVRNQMEASHNLRLQDYATCVAAKKGPAKFIHDSVNETYYKDLQHATIFYNSVTAKQLLLHLSTNCRGMEPEDLIALQTAMTSYYTKCDGIPKYIIKLKKARATLIPAALPMSNQQLLTITSASVYAAQDFSQASEDWERLLPAAKTWVAWKTAFLGAHHE